MNPALVRHIWSLADVRHVLTELGKAAADFSATARVPGPNRSTRAVPMFVLPKDLTLTLVSDYSIPMRHRIVTRWQELEAAQVRPQAALTVDGHDIREVMRALVEVAALVLATSRSRLNWQVDLKWTPLAEGALSPATV